MLLEEDYNEAWDIFKEIENKKFFEFMDLSLKRSFFRSKKNNKPITPILIFALKDKMEYLSEEEKEIYHLFVYLRYKEKQESGISINAFNNSREYLKKIASKFYNKAQLYRKHRTNILCKNAVATPQGQYVKCKSDFINGLEVIRKRLDLSVNKFASIFKNSSNIYYQYLNNQGTPLQKTRNKIVSRLNEHLGEEYTIESIEKLGKEE